MLAPSGAFGLVLIIWICFLLILIGLLAAMFFKGISAWFGSSRKRDARTAAAIALPVLVAVGLFVAWFTDSARLAETAFDDVLDQSLVPREDYGVQNVPNGWGCSVFTAAPGYRPSPSLAEFVIHDAEALEVEGWVVALFVSSDQESPGWAFEAERENTLVHLTTVSDSTRPARPTSAESGINYYLYQGCSELTGLAESGSWEQVAAFDPPPG